MVDIDDTIGQEVSAEFKDQFGNENVHFIHCDVTDSPSLEGITVLILMMYLPLFWHEPL